MKKQSIDELKSNYVGKIFNWLTVLDIFRDDNGIVIFRCKCKCGDITDKYMKNVISGHTMSCGCYNHSKEHSDKYKQWCKNNPDKLSDKANNYSKWCKDNPDKVRAKSIKRLKTLKENPNIQLQSNEKQIAYWKDHPDLLKDRGKKKSHWCKNNPDKVKASAEKCSLFYKNNPDKKIELGNKISQWYSSHNDRVEKWHSNLLSYYENNKNILVERGKLRSLYYKDHPELLTYLSDANKSFWSSHKYDAILRGKKVSQWAFNNRENLIQQHLNLSNLYLSKRICYDFSVLKDITYPDDFDQLLLGNIKSTDNIRTKCPLCNEFDSHTLHNIFILGTGKLKLGSAPLCTKCRQQLTSSHYEDDIADFISTFYNGEAIRNDRNIIAPLELDLYYPEKKIAVEFNGDYWHSSIYKEKEYHYKKFKLCWDSGITLVSIFESYWKHNGINIKLYLRDLFDNKENELSFNKCYMNNNFPCIYCSIDDSCLLDDSYQYNNMIIYTCGFTKLMTNKGDPCH